MGFELSDEGSASYKFDQNNGNRTGNTVRKHDSNAGKKGSSIYHLVSKKGSETEQQQQPIVKQPSSSSLKKVQFKELDTSIESDSSQDRLETEDDTMDDFDPTSEETHSETQESFDDSYNSGSESSIPESYKSPSKRMAPPQEVAHVQDAGRPTDDDDFSMSAFVPASVRRESVLPPRGGHDDTSELSEDGVDFCHSLKYNTNSQLVYSSQDSSESDRAYKKQRLDDTEDETDEECDQAEMDDLLDEAMDEISEVEMRKKEPHPAPVSYLIKLIITL